MTPESKLKLRNLLIQNEQFKQFPYTDTTGHLTIGIGRNLVGRGISYTEALYLLDDDVDYFSSKLSLLLSFFDSLDDSRQICIIDMCFNVGLVGFLNFHEMITACENKDYIEASKQILNSKAAKQAPERYQQLAKIMATGEL
jgi:lysozyme